MKAGVGTYVRRALVLVVVVGVLLGIAVVGGNTIGRAWLEQRVRSQLAAQLVLSGPPTVEIRDRIVALSLIRQRFDDVHVVLPGVQLATFGTGVRADVGLVLEDVRVSDDFTRYVAGTLRGTTEFSWEQITAVVQHPVAPAQGGRVSITYEIMIAGFKTNANVSAKPAVDQAGSLILAEPAVVVAGIQVPAAVVKQISDALMKPINLGLPGSLRAVDVTASPMGLMVHLEGKDVDLSALG